MCRLWNPTSEEVIANEKAQKEREAINKKRIELVRALKKKYGKMFIGGIKNDAYARNVCPDLVLDEKLTRKKRYLSIMKKCGICIATTGLHESTGWKFAEYVAAGKAIVSEPLHYEVFGEFIAGKNYLEFNSTEECINQIEILLSDSKLRHFIEKANRKYYKNYERPDKQIQNALLLAERMSNRTTNKSGKAKE